MKFNKMFFSAIICTSLLTTSCSDDKMSEEYLDPEGSLTTNIEYLFTNMQDNASYRWSYWDMGTMVLQNLAVYAQSCGYFASPQRFEQNPSYSSDRWKSYYVTLATYREMEMLLSKQKTEDIEGYTYMIQLAKAVMILETQKATDLWGDMPFTEAGFIRDDKHQIIFPKYDTQESIYIYMLDELKKINTAIDVWEKSSYGKKSTFEGILKTQDLMFKGNSALWKKFVNSLRLRVAMRISNIKENEAKTAIQEILNNPSVYPIIDNNAENALIKAVGPDLLANTNTHENGLKGAFDYQSEKNYAPGLMTNIMLEAGDPRTKVYFSANKQGQIIGMDPSWTENQQTSLNQQELISRFDSTTIWMNDFVPHLLLTAAEVSFMKAEAYERWGSGNAKESYEKGIKQSIEFWYSVQDGNTSATSEREPLPTEAQIEAAINSSKYAYGTNNLEKIGTQKWIHFNVLMTYDSWAEQRRTDYPALAPEIAGSTGEFKTRSVRLNYPTSEISRNGNNYQQVKDKDKPTLRLWWDVK